ncbi:MAG: glutamate-cysteine ligase family protein [Acidimicrobiales bacterium]
MEDRGAPLSRRDVLEHLAAHDCAPSHGPPKLGLEQEWHTYDLAEPDRHLQPDEVLGAATAGGPLPSGSVITVEPGGQIELSTPPAEPWWRALDDLRIDGAILRRRLGDAGFATLAAGLDPFREPARTLTRPRYDAMQAYFDEWGPEGRRMMSSCASIQVNIDSGDTATLARRWDLAHRIGPAMAATFACSPGPLHRSERLATWNAMDPTRTKPVLASGQLAEDWADYVLEARLMLLHDDDDRCELVAVPITFGEWVDQGIAGRHPTLADLDYHCTTLFPPVRPRGWLEVRWLDCLPAGIAEVASAAVAALLIDEDASAEALEACAGVDRRASWATTASLGTQDPALAASGGWLLSVAAAALDRSEAPGRWAEAVGAAAERWPAKGRSPADELEERLATGATVLDMADPPLEVHP